MIVSIVQHALLHPILRKIRHPPGPIFSVQLLHGENMKVKVQVQVQVKSVDPEKDVIEKTKNRKNERSKIPLVERRASRTHVPFDMCDHTRCGAAEP